MLKSQVEPERHRIQTEFKQLRSILDREEQRELKKLEVEERKGLSIIEKAEGDLIHQSQSLKDLISDLEHRCQGSTVELLQVRLTDCVTISTSCGTRTIVRERRRNRFLYVSANLFY